MLRLLFLSDPDRLTYMLGYLDHSKDIFISVLCYSFIIRIVSSIAISVDAGLFRS